MFGTVCYRFGSLRLVPQTLSTRVGQNFEVEVHILKMKFDKDLCLNLQYDFGKMNSTLGSVMPLAMFEIAMDLLTFPFSVGQAV